jgi:N2-acetyl-L-2,4-diaminobutanoate deacetylase
MPGVSGARPEPATGGVAAGAPWQGVRALSPGTSQVFQLPVAGMPDGSTVAIPINVAKGTEEGPTLLVVAGQHGDEHDGPASLINVWGRLRPGTLRGTVVVVPVLNPPAFRAARRRGPDDDVDLNRVFPGAMDGTLTHRIARVFVERVLTEADFVLSMHGWSTGYVVEPYVEFPGWAATSGAAWAGARAFGLALLNPLGAAPGRLMTEASARGIPLIEVEIGGLGSTRREWRARYEAGTDRLLRHLGMSDGPPPEPDAPVSTIDRHECLASAGGLLRPEVEVGDQVVAGQTLATLHDLNLRAVGLVEATVGGIVGVLRLNASVLPGQLVATLFSPSPYTPAQ